MFSLLSETAAKLRVPYLVATSTIIFYRREMTIALGSVNDVFAVPCKHPDAVDGVFYCIPSYFDASHMRAEYGFVLVDTKKVISELTRNNPRMLEHAEYKFRGETAEQWLKGTSVDYPRDMGFWTYDGVHRPLAMCSGQASLIKVAQELEFPYFPIAVEKAYANLIDSKFGYTSDDLPRPIMRPRKHLQFRI